MSGFENMRSNVNALLHGPLDDPYQADLGISRKGRPQAQRTPPATTGGAVFGSGGGGASLAMRGPDEWAQYRGRRVDARPQGHIRDLLAQDPQMVAPQQSTGSLTEVRFGSGFRRRLASAINSDAPRLAADAKRAEVVTVRDERVRQRHADRHRALNILSWDPSAVASHFNTEQSRATNYGQHSFLTSSAPQPPPLYPSSPPATVVAKRVFREKYPAVAGPPGASAHGPEDSPKGRRAQASAPSGGGSRRDGGWSVGQQLHCYDGFVLPQVQPTGDKLPRPREPQASTRPW